MLCLLNISFIQYVTISGLRYTYYYKKFKGKVHRLRYFISKQFDKTFPV